MRARVVVDLAGLTLAGLGYVGEAKEITGLGKHYFPESVVSTTVVNAPWAFAQVFKLVSPLLTPVQRRKIRVLGTDFEAGLLEHAGLPLAALPRFLGGTTPDSQCPAPEKAAAVSGI